MNPPPEADDTASCSSRPEVAWKGPDMKRAAAKRLIERYFYQLTDGCGNPACTNKFCASSGELRPMTPDEAAAQAIQLFSQDARLCDRHPHKIARTQAKSKDMDAYKESNASAAAELEDDDDDDNGCSRSQSKNCPSEVSSYLSEQSLYELLDECEENNTYAPLIRKIGEVFSSIDNLARSFSHIDSPPSAYFEFEETLASGQPQSYITTAQSFRLKKEFVRKLQGEKDKDIDSSSTPDDSQRISVRPVNLTSVKRAYNALFKVKSEILETPMVNALVTLAGNLQMELPTRKEHGNHDDIINVLLIVFEIPTLGTGDYLETALPALCRASERLPVEVQAKLAKLWSGPGRSSIRTILENLHQLVTLRVIVTQFHLEFYVQDENVVTAATKLMKILYYANILAGTLESPELRYNDDLSSLEYSDSETKLIKNTQHIDVLGNELGVHTLDCRKPYLPFTEFYNEPLSDAVEMDRDFANYRSEMGKFCFMNYPFILTPATKMMGLYFDNRIRMYSERRISLWQTVSGTPSNPYLRLKVRRDHIIDDALVELEMISMENPNDLRKQLVVEFEGEQGIDEGGVSKEFFQLVIDEIFNPDYAMFLKQPDTEMVWFNPTSFESNAQFKLIGIVLGLAIYNNIILAVNFPMVLYRKLMGKRGSFEDLEDWNPTLYNSLKDLLKYSETDIDDVFMQTFRISYRDVFGNVITHELKENGDEVPVTQENKYEFVDLYADYLLNKSVEKQFRAFYNGFQMVVEESPLDLLFRPEEVECLICGSKNFDFDELENSTQYDAGYSSESRIIKEFWEVVHALSLEDGQKLLQFATGSDRVPIGGLSRLKLVIARNGPDSDRLPTAHTCFNVLLLPEYETKEKLKDRLIKAINYSKGFGML